MIELTFVPAALRSVLWLYVFLGLGALLVALIKPVGTMAKMGWTVVVIVAFGLVPFLLSEDVKGDKLIRREAEQKRSLAMDHFRMRCESAGEKINRVVENVDGVVWMKWWSSGSDSSRISDQFGLVDPYGSDCLMEGCIFKLLRASSGQEEFPTAAKGHESGYSFVETVDPRDGIKYRYTGALKSLAKASKEEFGLHINSTGAGAEVGGAYFALTREPIAHFSARYGIEWADISTDEDREKWIAGGSIKLIDIHTQEEIASRVGYLMDPGRGSAGGFRNGWGWAKSYGPRCPNIDERTWAFSARVLKPRKRGENNDK